MTEYIDFSFYTEHPRKEYVGIMRVPEPRTFNVFLRQVEEAALLAVAEHRARYDRVPKRLRLLVQRGKSQFSAVQVSIVGDKVKVESWSASRNSSLFELMAQWRFLESGRVVGYYEYLDKPTEDSEKMERLLFRESNVGMLTVSMVMRAAETKIKQPKSETLSILRSQKDSAIT